VAQQLRRPPARSARQLEHVAGRAELLQRWRQFGPPDRSGNDFVEVLGRASAVIGDLLGK
jgi:hypothetical protein